jgi:glutathione S-transferase
MKIFGSLSSPFVRKSRVFLHEKGIAYEYVRENPRALDSFAQHRNPLGKVPVLERNDGRTLIDSHIINAYLDALGGWPLLAPAGEARWEALQWEALADGLLDAVMKRLLEERRPESLRSAEFLGWEERRIARVLEALARADKPNGFLVGHRFGLADIAVGVALEYVDFRYPHDWRAQHPELGAWLATLSARPSFQSTALSPEP